MRGVVDQFVRWFLSGTFRPRNDEGGWCRHIFRESNKVDDTHANWLMDNGDPGHGAQLKRRDHQDKLRAAKHVVLSFDGARRGNGVGAAAWTVWIRNMNGEFERISPSGKVLKDATAMTAEREALRMGVEHLMTLFPMEAKDFQFVVENEGRETKYILNAQSLRLFGLRNDNAEDVHRADANRLEKKSGMGQRAVAKHLGVSQSMLSKWVREYKKGDFDDRNRLDMRAKDGYWPVDARAVDKDVLAEIKKTRIAHMIVSKFSQENQCIRRKFHEFRRDFRISRGSASGR